MSKFLKDIPKEPTIFDKIKTKAEQILEETTDIGDVVRLLIETNKLLTDLKSVQEFKIQNVIQATKTFSLSFANTTEQDLQFIKNISTNSYIHIHKMFISTTFPIIFQLLNIENNEGIGNLGFYVDNNYVIENLRAKNIKDVGLNLFGQYALTASTGHTADITIHYIVEFKEVIRG